MSLRPLLEIASENERLHALAGGVRAAPGGEPVEIGASSTLRPLLLATLLDDDRGLAGRPALLVSADDRSARDLAADLRAYLAPRRRAKPAGRSEASGTASASAVAEATTTASSTSRSESSASIRSPTRCGGGVTCEA